MLDNLWIYDVNMPTSKPTVTIDGKETNYVNFHNKQDKQMIHVTSMNLTMTQDHVVTWK